jgi:prefoldin subunit 5
MFKKVLAQAEIYTPKINKADFDKDETKIQQEITDIEKKYTPDRQIAIDVTFDNKKMKLSEFLRKLKQQVFDLKEIKDVKGVYNTALFSGIGGTNVSVNAQDAQEALKRDIAALEKQIQVREQTLAEIDNYVVTLLSGEIGQLNIAHTNAKFVKIADKPSEEEVLEPVEDYFDKLYDDTPGSPNYGKLMTHPEKHRNELSTEAQVQTSKPKFKKK